jgi:hypothetical protein
VILPRLCNEDIRDGCYIRVSPAVYTSSWSIKLTISSPVSHTLNYLHRKYPNPFATHVHTVDTLSRHVDPDTGIIRSERIIGVQQGAPKWITKLFSLPPVAYVREIVFINPPGTGGDETLPTSTSMSINLSLAQYVYVPPTFLLIAGGR